MVGHRIPRRCLRMHRDDDGTTHQPLGSIHHSARNQEEDQGDPRRDRLLHFRRRHSCHHRHRRPDDPEEHPRGRAQDFTRPWLRHQHRQVRQGVHLQQGRVFPSILGTNGTMATLLRTSLVSPCQSQPPLSPRHIPNPFSSPLLRPFPSLPHPMYITRPALNPVRTKT
ncbi:hypothetical protein BCR44DRAFT_1204146 [Catenaria anguillulae PL171]|uniref:Uncharacterized protein n=1 Tax=Catenaria anguillulae PL171 TaxID=765915 RepID=A0A1Y2H4V0_9FUNG|nr:hypothetical protein BCR44DRAFT_1204146 [Catenaria anguillulae PL171]